MKKIIKKIHFMGISGSGVSGVASLASKMGYKVTGCDLQKEGHSKDHLKDIDLLIVTPAVFYQSLNNPELIEGRKRGIVITWQEFLGKYLMKDKFVIAIAGTHGKSTTTAMVGKLLEDNGFDPIVILGANIPEWKANYRFGKGKYFVPKIAIINNIEFDHPDYFKDVKQLRESFDKFINNLTGDKVLITQKDSFNKKFNLKVLGEHNQKNANMVFCLGKKLNISEENIINSLENFKGIKRRLELIGEENRIKVYDDYAHHPTAITATLEALKNANSKTKIWAIVEPHGFNRTNALFKLYNSCFEKADKVIIGPIFKARDNKTFGITPKIVAKETNHKDAIGVNSIDEIIGIIKKDIKPGDIILVMGAGNSNLWAKEILESLKGNISFKDLTTMKVGGKIKYYKEVNNKEELVKQIKFAKKNSLPIFIIGGGSDILVSDNDFNGLVIKYVGDSIKVDGSKIIAEAGVIWDKLVETSVSKNLQGLECLSGIPGTVGASPIQNIGAYGQELKDILFKLTAYDIKNDKFIVFKKDDCRFGYRESIFKKKDNSQKFIITNVTLKLQKYVDTDLKLQNIRNEILRVRSEKLENPDIIPNAGSFFKNPIVNLSKKNELVKMYKDIKFYSFENSFKIPAGYLIEKAGWKGKRLGNVKVSDKHALILTNPEGKGNFNDIKKLADEITNDVYNKFKIKLEPEVQYINI
ncbi:MAG: UDP-N-acetylenolpyruvoylglucosamine reductase [Candidatus Woesebacteria bacterium GW2011_GWE2_31_6]|nr:MAG: UDP-N-acetylenolpyruvoylglucosamine reductase [Candidatus Woesebacteria bacterium GW2011_GWE2_31_6]